MANPTFMLTKRSWTHAKRVANDSVSHQSTYENHGKYLLSPMKVIFIYWLPAYYQRKVVQVSTRANWYYYCSFEMQWRSPKIKRKKRAAP